MVFTARQIANFKKLIVRICAEYYGIKIIKNKVHSMLPKMALQKVAPTALECITNKGSGKLMLISFNFFLPKIKKRTTL